jgi:hypothetical protein
MICQEANFRCEGYLAICWSEHKNKNKPDNRHQMYKSGDRSDQSDLSQVSKPADILRG